MYKYIKGMTVLSEEKMPDSYEIAAEYNLWTPSENSTIPNGELVEFLVSTYSEQHNYKMNEYYYISNSLKILRVFPRKLAEEVMEEFMIYLQQNNIVKDENKIYEVANIKFIYKDRCPTNSCDIVSYDKFLAKKESKK